MNAVSSTLSDVATFARFGWGLRDYLRQRLTLPQAEAIVRQRLESREDNFLRMVERGVFGYPLSPYRPLLALAGCELGDLRAMLRARGLEGTLLALREAGVYVSFEEFKGRQPIVRQGRVIEADARRFANPFTSHSYQGTSGGSTGAASRVDIDLEHVAAICPGQMLFQATHGMLGQPNLIWRGIPPDGTGVSNVLVGTRLGNTPRKWFTPIGDADTRREFKYRLANRAFVMLGRAFGARIPRPEPLPIQQAAEVARWAIAAARRHGASVVRATASLSLRVCLAAADKGWSLEGVTFTGGSEPPTPAKVRRIVATGARWIPSYWFVEAGQIGGGCGQPIDGNDIHFMKDRLALIQYPRQVPGWDITVPAFHFTGLIPTTPKLLLNVESDDYGEVEQRACGCALERYGFPEHLRGIRSFRKLTGEGVTLIGSDLERILEEVLPARFGGTPQDYQLQEVEDAGGFTRLNLLISPRVTLADESQVIDALTQALGHTSPAADLAQATWRQAGTLRIVRQEPAWTTRGKLMPLDLSQRSKAGAVDPAMPRTRG